MTRLGKRHVEAMLAAYDDDPVAALTPALRLVLDAPAADWSTLLAEAPFSDERRAALADGDVAALDALFVELNEMRTLAP